MKLNTAGLSGACCLLLFGMAATPAHPGITTPNPGYRLSVCLHLISSKPQPGTLLTTQPVGAFSDNLVFTQSEGRTPGLPTDLRLVSRDDGIDWRFPKFFLRMKGTPVPFIYYIVEEDLFVLARRVREGAGTYLTFEMWRRRKTNTSDFIRVFRGPALPDGNGIVATYHPGRHLLMVGTDEGAYQVISTTRHSLFARLDPPAITAPDPVLWVEISPDASTAVVFHHHRMIIYNLNSISPATGIRDRAPIAFQHPIDRDAYPTASGFTSHYVVKGDSRGMLTFVNKESHLPTLQLNMADLADPSATLADGSPIVQGINVDSESGMLGVELYGAEKVIHIPAPEQLRAKSTKFNPMIWEKEARFFSPDIAAEVLLGRAIYEPEYNEIMAAQTLGLDAKVYAAEVGLVQQELRSVSLGEASEGRAYRVLLYAKETRTPVASVIGFLKRRSFMLVNALRRRDVLGAALYILEATQGRGTNPSAIFNQVEEEIVAIAAALREFKAKMPAAALQKAASGRVRRNSPVPEAFWFALMKLSDLRVVNAERFWALIERLSEEAHPIESRILSYQEVLEAAHGVLSLTALSPPSREGGETDWFEELKEVVSLLHKSRFNRTGTFPKFHQAERILALARLDGATKWEDWFNPRGSEEFQTFEQLLGRLELRRGRSRARVDLVSPRHP